MGVNFVVHIVDDEPEVRRSLARLIESNGYRAVVHESAESFLADAGREEPGCVLLDLALGEVDGFKVQQAISANREPLPIVFVTGCGSVTASVTAMKAGAIDFLEKPIEEAPLIDALRRALAHDASGRLERQRQRTLTAAYATLTPREREVFGHVVAGRLNKQIAWDIGACERTVKAHRARVMAKMGAHSVAELVHLADQLEAFANEPTLAKSA